ncbi:Uncharacterised protein [Mycobacterium tuberculosis]|nr:Uncharacterised protein [Mycobacterium tuberculosis]
MCRLPGTRRHRGCSQNVGPGCGVECLGYLTGPTSREPANQELCAVERHNHVAMRAVYASCAHFAAKRAFQRTHGAFVPRHGGIILH